MIIKEGPIIQCKKCFKRFDFVNHQFDYPETSSDERDMGYETQYLWEYDFNCDKCNNDIYFAIEGFEYPQGVMNYQNFTTNGAMVISEPKLDIEYFEDDEND